MRAADVDKLKRDIVEFKTSFQSTNQDYMTGYISALSVVEGMIATLPTITLDDLRPKGRWIMKETMIRSPFAKNAYCSECNEETSFLHDFCPYCGADMRGGDKRCLE